MFPFQPGGGMQNLLAQGSKLTQTNRAVLLEHAWLHILWDFHFSQIWAQTCDVFLQPPVVDKPPWDPSRHRNAGAGAHKTTRCFFFFYRQNILEQEDLAGKEFVARADRSLTQPVLGSSFCVCPLPPSHRGLLVLC